MGSKHAIFVYCFVCPSLAGSLGAGQTCWRSRELAVCRQGKLRSSKGGDCLRLEEKVGWVPALGKIPEVLRDRQEAAAGCTAG